MSYDPLNDPKWKTVGFISAEEIAKLNGTEFVKLLQALAEAKPIDCFDSMTSRGYRLNLITGEYYKPLATNHKI